MKKQRTAYQKSSIMHFYVIRTMKDFPRAEQMQGEVTGISSFDPGLHGEISFETVNHKPLLYDSLNYDFQSKSAPGSPFDALQSMKDSNRVNPLNRSRKLCRVPCR